MNGKARQPARNKDEEKGQPGPEKSRQLAELQVKTSHRLAKEFRELAQEVHET
jgi:hypothetical protein